MNRHTAPMTDDYLRGLRRRNELRMNHARLMLGERWLLHPANAVRRTATINYSPSLFAQQLGRIKRDWSLAHGVPADSENNSGPAYCELIYDHNGRLVGGKDVWS